MKYGYYAANSEILLKIQSTERFGRASAGRIIDCIRFGPLSERYCIENYHSKIIAGVLKNEKH